MRVPDGERWRLVLDHVAVDLDARRHGFTYCGYLTVIVEGADRADPPFQDAVESGDSQRRRRECRIAMF